MKVSNCTLGWAETRPGQENPSLPLCHCNFVQTPSHAMYDTCLNEIVSLKLNIEF